MQTVQDYERVFKSAYATVLDIPPADVNLQKVACGGRLLSDPSNASGSSSSSAPTAPRPARHRALLQSTGSHYSFASTSFGAAARSLLRTSATLQQTAPAAVRTVFAVPAPKDPTERQKRIELINQNSGQVLGPPMTVLFEHPVDVEPPVLLNGAMNSRQVPSAPPAPQGQTGPAAAGEGTEEVEPDVEELPGLSPQPLPALNGTDAVNGTALNGTSQLNATVELLPPPLVNGTASANATSGPNATTAVPEVPAPPPPFANVTNGSLPQPSSPSPNPVNVSAPSPSPPAEAIITSPVPVFMPPAPPAPIVKPDTAQQQNWEKVQPCLAEPTGSNSIPDKQGRLWGWINGESCAFKTATGKIAITVSWDTAADCTGTATTSNSVFDTNGRLWGWQDGRSCAFRGEQAQAPGPPGQQLVTWDIAPTCKGAPWGSNAVRGGDGQLWGYENGKSCAFRVPGASQAVTWAAAPPSVGAPHYYRPVKDSLGRLWGWENGRSCRF
jgi:hypothetical protein